jgi:hypothetical protein
MLFSGYACKQRCEGLLLHLLRVLEHKLLDDQIKVICC